MKNLIKKIRVRWLNNRIAEYNRRMSAAFYSDSTHLIARAFEAKWRALILKRNALLGH